MNGGPVAQPLDPWSVLGLSPGAGDEAVRAAYLRELKQHPPDRSAEQFERIRDAYEALRDPRRRAAAVLTADEPGLGFESWLDRAAPERRWTGPRPWLRVVRGA